MGKNRVSLLEMVTVGGVGVSRLFSSIARIETRQTAASAEVQPNALIVPLPLRRGNRIAIVRANTHIAQCRTFSTPNRSRPAYWQPVKASVAAVEIVPAVAVSGVLVLVWLVCIWEGLQSAVPAWPGTNAKASMV